jgi:hypothetical protein
MILVLRMFGTIVNERVHAGGVAGGLCTNENAISCHRKERGWGVSTVKGPVLWRDDGRGGSEQRNHPLPLFKGNELAKQYLWLVPSVCLKGSLDSVPSVCQEIAWRPQSWTRPRLTGLRFGHTRQAPSTSSYSLLWPLIPYPQLPAQPFISRRVILCQRGWSAKRPGLFHVDRLKCLKDLNPSLLCSSSLLSSIHIFFGYTV